MCVHFAQPNIFKQRTGNGARHQFLFKRDDTAELITLASVAAMVVRLMVEVAVRVVVVMSSVSPLPPHREAVPCPEATGHGVAKCS
jgi:hypothetical protein